jgi:hypothetical protein
MSSALKKLLSEFFYYSHYHLALQSMQSLLDRALKNQHIF